MFLTKPLLINMSGVSWYKRLDDYACTHRRGRYFISEIARACIGVQYSTTVRRKK